MSDSEGDDVLDWSLLVQAQSKPSKQIEGAAVLKRGEKDHAPDGTGAQQRVLQRSRDAMYGALSAPRGHTAKSVLVGEWNATYKLARITQIRGNYLVSMGTAMSHGEQWLDPEEVIYLVERGSMVCYYNGHILSVQGILALCLSAVGTERYIVYSHLKRLGYIVRRSRPPSQTYPSISAPTDQPRAWEWLVSGLLGRPRLAWRASYSSYASVFRDLRVIQPRLTGSSDIEAANEHTPGSSNGHQSENCAVDYDAWKPGVKFRKSAPPPPEFRVKVVRGDGKMPALFEMESLLAGVPANCPTQRSITTRMRTGTRSIVLAVVDSGVVAFIRTAETAIEPLI